MNINLRLFRDDDFDAFHAIVSEYDVVKMTSSWPYPPEEDFTRMRMTTPESQAGQVNVIEVDGALAGVVGIVNDEIGYHIGQAFWGKGIMTQAVNLKIAEYFSDPDNDLLKSCVWSDNPASGRVLEKVGFQKSHMCSDFCKARNVEVEAIHFELSRTNWAARAGDI